MTLNEAIKIMTGEIVAALTDNNPSIYLFGSVALDDFKFGWSDIDILVLTEREITQRQAETLVGLRQVMEARYPGNPHFRLFEGGMLSAGAFINGKNERTVYWGTTGQRLTDSFRLDSFGTAELLDNGKLLYGSDIRDEMVYPAYAEMRGDIARHMEAARKYGVSVGWLLDIARGVYTLRTGKIIAKTAAGVWALEYNICPDEDAMQIAVAVRKTPANYSKEEKCIDNTVIQRFADVIDAEFSATVRCLAESELRRMNIAFDALSLIRDKDGVSVWRVSTGNGGSGDSGGNDGCDGSNDNSGGSVVMKCFDKPEYRREITNYRLLNALGIPTLKIIAQTGCSIIIEDIERSIYRLGTMEDINDPNIAAKIAIWYKSLHENGREYINTHAHEFIDECDGLTLDNLKMVQEKTGTARMGVWRLIEKHFAKIKATAMDLSRTLVYTDFHYSNLAVARDGTSALIFDYNFIFKGYAYSDIRNVCGNFYNEEAKTAFLAAYGAFDEREAVVDNVVSVLTALIIACSRKIFPDWAKGLLERIKDGRLLAAVEKLMEEMDRGHRNEY